MFRFLHAADLHLDSPLRGLERYDGCPVDEVRRASRRAFENLVSLALSEKVAFVLIAGDLYDGDLADYGPCLFLNEQLIRLREASIPAFMIQGNHDAASSQTKHLKLPENVHRLAIDRPETKRLDEFDTAIHGQGFATRAVKENLALGYPKPIAGMFNLGLLHTSVDGREGHESYAPCTLEHLMSKGYDYWALGHIHKAESLLDDPPIVFPGNLQGRHIRETGSKGAVLVQVDGGRVVAREHRSLDVMRWEVCPVDATGAENEDDLVERAVTSLGLVESRADGRPVVTRVEIRGRCKAHERLAGTIEKLAAEIRREARDVGGGQLWVEKVVVKTSPEQVDATLDGPLGAVRDRLDRLRSDPTQLQALAQRELADLKKKLPKNWEDISGRPMIDSIPNLLEALDHVGPELIAGLSGIAEDADR